MKINELENKKIMEKIKETTNWFLQKIKLTNLRLDSATATKVSKKVRNERGKITTATERDKG